MAACTSCSAMSMFRSSENCSVISELPKELIGRHLVSPGTCPNCFSSGAVIEDVTTSGLAPG